MAQLCVRIPLGVCLDCANHLLAFHSHSVDHAACVTLKKVALVCERRTAHHHAP
jgi:hypothetical protein